LLGALLAGLAGTACAADRLLATVGDVTPNGAVLWARAPSRVTVKVGRAGGPLEITQYIDVDTARDHSGKTLLSGLRPGTRYAFRLTSSGSTVRGDFTTAPEPSAREPVTFAWSGDLGAGAHCRKVDGGYPIFGPLAARQPRFFLFVGDTIYADQACERDGLVPGSDFVARTLAGYHAKHRYNRADARVQAAFRRIPVYAIWDDHEVRNDFAGTAEPLMRAGRQAFLDYWPILPSPDEPDRLHRRFRWGKLLEVVILDTRQYRTPNAVPDGPGKTMLGDAQRAWLVDAVTTSDAVWKVIVSSVPLSIPNGPRERRDGWSGANVFGMTEDGATGFAHERDAILGAFRRAGVKNVIVITADVHHAEIIRHEPAPGFTVHELVAGPLSATFGVPRPLDEALNPVSLWRRSGVNNFGEASIQAERLTVRIIGEDGTVLGSHVIDAE
jgi:alkaline phosphatase D